MFLEGIVRKPVSAVQWQDYRASNTGLITVYVTDSVSEMPIREVPEEFPTDVVPDPNYETGTVGFYGCSRTKIRSTLHKSRIRYMFFMAKYMGTRDEFADNFYVNGFYRISKWTEAVKLHMRYLSEPSCANLDTCTAFLADEVHFVSLEDSIAVTKEVLSKWGFSGALTRQSRIILDEEKTTELLALLRGKENITKAYIEETRRLEPTDPEAEVDEEEEE